MTLVATLESRGNLIIAVCVCACSRVCMCVGGWGVGSLIRVDGLHDGATLHKVPVTAAVIIGVTLAT